VEGALVERQRSRRHRLRDCLVRLGRLVISLQLALSFPSNLLCHFLVIFTFLVTEVEGALVERERSSLHRLRDRLV